MSDGASRSPGTPRRRHAALRWTILILAALGGGAAILLSQIGGAAGGGGPAGEATQEVARTPVRVTTPTFGTLERTFEVSGYLESDQVITVTPKVQGTLEELLVDLGDRVTQGQKIAEIDDESYRLDLRRAEANFAAAESTFNRTKELYDSDATSRQNYDQARSQYDAAQVQLELARLQMRYTSVSASARARVALGRRHTGSAPDRSSGALPV